MNPPTSLNDITAALKKVKSGDGYDAFQLYREGRLSKASLMEHIAVELLKLDAGE